MVSNYLASNYTKKMDTYFHLYLMEYDNSDSFPFDFEPNGIPIDSKSKG